MAMDQNLVMPWFSHHNSWYGWMFIYANVYIYKVYTNGGFLKMEVPPNHPCQCISTGFSYPQNNDLGGLGVPILWGQIWFKGSQASAE